MFWFPLSAALAPDVDVLAVQYPGRQERRHEPPITDLDEFADAVARALTPLLDRPYALLGHSMGALLGYEVARRLRRWGHPAPVGLFASGRRAPHINRGEDVHLRDDAGVVAELRRMSGTDSGLLGDDELLRLVLPAVRADYQAVETYRYQPGRALDCRSRYSPVTPTRTSCARRTSPGASTPPRPTRSGPTPAATSSSPEGSARSPRCYGGACAHGDGGRSVMTGQARAEARSRGSSSSPMRLISCL